jgi:glucan phosphoethanolaminetransferase (alkaline phosphatase superfamily)
MAQNSPFQEHYLQVQALTQVTSDVQAEPQSPSSMPNLNTLFIACAFFAISFIIAAIYLLRKRSSELKHILIVASLAIGVGTIPIVVALSQQSADIRGQANELHTPQNVIVSLTDTGFLVSWNTATETIGALRVRQVPGQHTKQTVLTESGPTTQHSLNLANLNPATYYFEILSGTVWYDNQGLPLSVIIE